MSMTGRRRLGAELLHQDDDTSTLIAGADAHALNVQPNLAPPAIDCVDLRVHALVTVPYQRRDWLFELFDGQADVEAKEVPSVYFVRAKTPQVRRHVVPRLHLQLLVEDDHCKGHTAQDAAEKDVSARQVGAALPELLVHGLELV